MNERDLQAYGRCPLGHNPRPSGETGDNISTTQIPEGEEQPLFWSNYHQDYICAMHLRKVNDLIDDDVQHEDFRDLEKKIQGMGFKTKTRSS